MRSQLQHLRALVWLPHSQHKQRRLSLAGHHTSLPLAGLLHFLPQRSGNHLHFPLRRLRDLVANLPQLGLPLDLLIPGRLAIRPGILFTLIHSLPSHPAPLHCRRFAPVPLYRRSHHAWPEHFP